MSSKLAKRFELVVLTLAVVGFYFIIRDVGLKGLEETASQVGSWFLVILVVELGMHLLNTLGLLSCFPRDRDAIGFVRLALVRFAGETVNMTTPTATVGGEVVKVSLLSRFGPPERLAASVSQAYATQMLAQMLFVAISLPITLPRLQLPLAVKLGFGGCVLGGFVFAAAFTAAMRAGPYGFLHRLVRRVGLGKEGGAGDATTRRMDEESRELSRERHAFAWSTLWFTLGWAYGIVELALIVHALGLGVSIWDCVAVESMACFWDALMFFVPAQLGTREAGFGGIFSALGHAKEVGFSVALVRRGRALFYAVLGLIALAALRRYDSVPQPTASAAPATTPSTEPTASPAELPAKTA